METRTSPPGAAGAPGGSDSEQKAGTDHTAPSEAASRLFGLIAEFREYLAYFLSARLDGAKATLRRTGLLLGMAAIGALAAATVVVAGVVLLMVGAAEGLGILFGHRPWLGSLTVGILVLLVGAVIAWSAFSRITRSMQKRTVKNYEQRQSWQHSRFGRNVQQAAARKTD